MLHCRRREILHSSIENTNQFHFKRKTVPRNPHLSLHHCAATMRGLCNLKFNYPESQRDLHLFSLRELHKPLSLFLSYLLSVSSLMKLLYITVLCFCNWNLIMNDCTIKNFNTVLLLCCNNYETNPIITIFDTRLSILK